MRVLVLLSGGIDSTTLLWKAKQDGHECVALSVYYGQRNERREMVAAYNVAKLAGVERLVCTIPPLGRSGDVVHARNAVLISIATAIALKEAISEIWFGANRSDYQGFPDCRLPFFEAMESTLRLGGADIKLEVPLIFLDKREVVALAKELGVPINMTFSCYEPAGDEQCGQCSACVLRERAIG